MRGEKAQYRHMFKHTLCSLAMVAIVAPAMAADENRTVALPAAFQPTAPEHKLDLVDGNGRDR